MINRISKKLAIFLFRKGVIKENEIDVYVYGYEVLISSIVDFFIVLLFAVCFDKLLIMNVFFIMFVSIRIYTGGYHADTFLRCKLVFIAICSFIILISNITIYFPSMIIAMAFYNVTVIMLSPVENSNKPLTNEEKNKYREISIVLSIIWTLFAVITYFVFIDICRQIVITALIIALLMIWGENKYRKEVVHNEKYQNC